MASQAHRFYTSIPRLFRNHYILAPTIVLQAFCAVHYTFANFFYLGPAAGPSMLPTLYVWGDSILVDKTCHSGRGIGVGDLVYYKTPTSIDQFGVKRVLGMPGDHVMMGTPGEAGEDKMIQVPKGHCYVTGDNLHASRDSRSFGPLPLGLVRGKVVAKVFPWSERRWIENPLQRVEGDL